MKTLFVHCFKRTGGWLGIGGILLVIAIQSPALPQTNQPAATSSVPSPAPDPCDGLFQLVSRPTVTTSSCSVKPKDTLIEFGYVNATTGGSGNSSTFPNASLRVGLARQLEADIQLPTYTRQSAAPIAAGFGDLAAGLKYQFGYSKNTINAFHVFLNAASGARSITGGAGGVTASYDVSYSLSSKFGLAGTFGYNSLALQGVDGVARRYSSLNPSIVLSNSFQKNIQGYLELYGATSSGPNQTGRYCFDGGVQGDVSQHLQLDGSIGTQCINFVGRPAHYVNFGGAVRL